MNRGLKDVLTALDKEYYISMTEEEQIILKRADYNRAVMLRTSYYDKRTLDKYWDVMNVIGITHLTNQYKAVLNVEHFCDVLGISSIERRKPVEEGRGAICVISE